MTLPRAIAVLTLLLLVWPAAGGALAAAPQAKAQAQALLTEGYHRAEQGDFVTALDKFEQAFALHPSPNLLLNIGTSLQHLGRNAEAAAAYERYLRTAPPDAARRAEVEGILAEITQLVGTLTVVAEAPGASVRINGRQLEGFDGRARFAVDPGDYTVAVERADGPPALAHGRLLAGEHRTLVFFGEPDSSGQTTDGSTQRAVAYGLGGLGIAALTVAAVFGVLALASEAERADDPAPELEHAAARDATVAGVGLAVGATALGAAVLVYLTAPDDTDDETDAVATVAAGALPGAAAGVRFRLRW